MSAPLALRQRLLRQFLMLAIVPLVALTALAVLVMLPSLMAAAEQHNRLLSSALRDQLQQQLQARLRAANVVAAALRTGRVTPQEVDASLRSLLEVDPFVLAAYVTDQRGVIRHIAVPADGALNARDLIGLDQSGQEHYRLARASGAAVWSETFLSLLTSRITAVLVVPAGQMTLMVEFSLDELSQTLAQMGQAGWVRAVVLDRAGRIIGHPQPEHARRQESLAHLPLVERAIHGRPESGRIQLDGAEYLADILPVFPTGWHVLVAEPTRLVLAPLLRLGWVLAGCLAATIGGAVAFAWWLARRSGQEVTRLTAAAQRAVDGAAPNAPRFDTAEFAELWSRLNSLFERVRERDAQTDNARRELQAVLDAATEVVIVTTDSEGTVRLFGRGAQKLLGLGEGEVVGRATPALWHDPRELEQRGRQLTQEFGRPIHGIEALFAPARLGGYEVRDWTLVRADGSQRASSVALTAMRDGQGRPVGFLIVGVDVTERRRAAELEVARRTAEGASQAKSDFLSRMSHELRSPLNAMLGYAQLLEIDRQEPLTPAQTQRAQQIQRSGWHLVQLIDDVLDLSRIESGHLRVSIESVDLATVFARATEMAAPLMQRHGVTLSLRWIDVPEAQTLQPVAADMTRLTQVLVNLLSNAAKYNHPGGRVELEYERLADQRVALRVRDSGRGMTPDQVARLFEPFNRLGQETSGIEGTGIGLVITRRLVDLMHGELRVESRPGAGSVFTVLMPCAAASPGGAMPAPVPVPAGERPVAAGLVVYIEDNEVNATLMHELMRQRPELELVVAGCAADGLALLRQRPARLLMLDMHLPDATGHDVLDALAAEPGLRDLPVVVVSADATHRQVATTLRRGVVAYLTKPINVADALAVVDRVLNERVAARRD
jgi:PAS domain S-box-containing protein